MKFFFIICIYCSPSQNQDESKNFCTKFDILLNNINKELLLCSVVTDGFNAQGQELDSLTLSAEYTQIIDKPTHVTNNSMSCIDIVFCTNESVVSNRISIFDTCHHDIIYGNINIYLPLPPTYVQQIWDYGKANIENIKKIICNFDYNKDFENL